MMVNEATWQFVDKHLTEDVRQLALKKSKYNDIDFEFALRQIQGRQKTRDKLPSMGSIPRFVFPPSLALEQCSSEITARYKASVINNIFCRDGTRPVSVCPSSAENDTEMFFSDAMHCVSAKKNGKTMADLTGGFGIDTLFLSKLYETCHYVEPQQQLCDILTHNLNLLQRNNVIVHQDTMEHFIEGMDRVDLLYLDPSRRNMLGQKVAGLEDCTPNVLLYKDSLLKKAQIVLLKLSPMLDIKRALAQLPETRDVHVLAVNGECKELLFVLTADMTCSVRFHAVNLLSGKDEQNEIRFDFTDEEEMMAAPLLDSEVGAFLFEPNASVLKAGGFKCLATRFKLRKIHPHSHLYTSDFSLRDFPGRVFQVQEVLSFKEAKTALRHLEKANVAVRNFPMSSEELKRNLKLGDGGDVYLFGTTLNNGQKIIIKCAKDEQNQS